jgi:hypothetical protein
MKLIPITKLVNHEVAYLIMELWEAIDKLNKRLDTLADDNQQLMAQISAKAEQPTYPPVEVSLRNLIKEAKEKHMNIRTYYQDLIFTPESLEWRLAKGHFRWWDISNWELTTRKANMTLIWVETND